MAIGNGVRKVRVLDTIVIGGGHAGLCMSYVLQELGREHVVLIGRKSKYPKTRNLDVRGDLQQGGMGVRRRLAGVREEEWMR